MNKAMLALTGLLLVGPGLALSALAAPARAQEGPEMVEAEGAYDAGMITDPHVYLPKGKMAGVVFLISDAAGWGDADDAEARHLRDQGQAVVGLDLPSYLQGLEQHPNDCAYAIADIEDLSGRLQAQAGGDYRLPVIAGRGDGGGLALALAAQVPASTLAATVVVDPAAAIPLQAPLCTEAKREAVGSRFSYGLQTGPLNQKLDVVLTDRATPDSRAHVAALDADFPEMKVSQTAGATDAALQVALDARLTALAQAEGPLDLPLDEMPVAKPALDTMAIFYSGDGGWRDLDYEVGQQLQAAGVPVVGVDSLRYFWSERTPEETAADLSRIIRHYRAAWGVRHVVLLGYSFGADILPVSYDLLPDQDKASVAMLSLLALSHDRDFVIHVSGWLGLSSESQQDPTADLARVPPGLVQCVYGTEDDEDACHSLTGLGYELLPIKGGHHFDEDYPALTTRILDALKRRL